MLKDGQTAMAYYRSMWTPKDLEAAKGLSQKDVFSRFPQSAMETLFGMMAMQKQVEMGNARARKFSDSLEVANKENDLLAMKNTEGYYTTSARRETTASSKVWIRSLRLGV
ncbi:uncharacterized protein LOC132305097 [Cornus florida]|uniref:uncharacterized protein LOC132305097 n=1 Tax=Cornus florida TaxID=4283 RepID=UPI00289F4FAA|nr:uncharacterized protein LOC132305097 [Cornus florida]